MVAVAECLRRVKRLSKDRLNVEALRLSSELSCTEAQLVAHLSEIERRELPLEWGFSSLFEYCMKRLGMSEAEAYLRIRVARKCRRFPRLLELLAASRMSLTVAARVAPVLTGQNADEVLNDCTGMTRRQVDEYLTRFRPRPTVSSGVTPADDGRFSRGGGERPHGGSSLGGLSAGRLGSVGEVGSPGGVGSTGQVDSTGQIDSTAQTGSTGEVSATGVPGSAGLSGEGWGSHRDGRGRGNAKSGNAAAARSELEPARPGVFNVRFAADRELKEKIDRLGEVLGYSTPDRHLSEIVSVAVEIALEKKDPIRRQARREERKAREVEKKAKATASAEATAQGDTGSKPDSLRAEEPKSVEPTPEASSTSSRPSWSGSARRSARDRSSVRVEQGSVSLGSGLEAPRTSGGQSTSGDHIASGHPEGSGDQGAAGDQCSPGKNAPGLGASGSDARILWAREGFAGQGRAASRQVPASLRDLVFARAKHRCEFVSADGRRCEQRSRLEVDHVLPHGKGGRTEVCNLRVLCRGHNLWEAKREYGREFIAGKIAAARDSSGRGTKVEESRAVYRRMEPVGTYTRETKNCVRTQLAG